MSKYKIFVNGEDAPMYAHMVRCEAGKLYASNMYMCKSVAIGYVLKGVAESMGWDDKNGSTLLIDTSKVRGFEVEEDKK